MNAYVPRKRTPPKKWNKIDIIERIVNPVIIVVDFHIWVSKIDRTTRQNINRDKDFKNTISHLDLTEVHRTLHESKAYILF